MRDPRVPLPRKKEAPLAVPPQRLRTFPTAPCQRLAQAATQEGIPTVPKSVCFQWAPKSPIRAGPRRVPRVGLPHAPRELQAALLPLLVKDAANYIGSVNVPSNGRLQKTPVPTAKGLTGPETVRSPGAPNTRGRGKSKIVPKSPKALRQNKLSKRTRIRKLCLWMRKVTQQQEPQSLRSFLYLLPIRVMRQHSH